MKKKIVLGLIILISVCLLKLVITYAANESLIGNISKGRVGKNDGMILYIINYPEGYIAYYNNGNIYYKVGEYEKAIECYKKALSMGHPNNRKDCKIRINLVLSMLQTFDLNNLTDEKVKSILKVLGEAKEYLIENGCANRYDSNGHSEDAEKLKKEIEELEQALKSDNYKESESDEKNQDDKKQSDSSSSNTKEDRIRKIQKDANQTRENKKNNGNFTYDYYEGKTW
ncbi:MAG: tetratricopeptide repeat protein [Clostridia bacterium]|nr:tetratricopeptide repeat protein [Clostridia bacterium]